MNDDEFAFLNQQLAGLLKSGIPLEGALQQLCASMQRGALRGELEALRKDLANGVPLRDALPKRKLPPLYTRLALLGAQGNDLPGMLTLLADYYRKRYILWAKLKGLLVYPAIVLVASLSLSGLFVWLYTTIIQTVWGDLWAELAPPPVFPVLLWMPVLWVALVAIAFTCGLSVPAWREWLRWRVPGFRETSLCQFASTMKLLLASGGPLLEAIGLVRSLEQGAGMRGELELWQKRLSAGEGRFAVFASGSKWFPPLFIWLVGQGGEDMVGGFARAAEIYYERARYRVELLLYAALPVAVLMLGGLIFLQVWCLLGVIVAPLDMLGGGS